MLVKAIMGAAIILVMVLMGLGFFPFGGVAQVMIPDPGVSIRQENGLSTWSPPLQMAYYCGLTADAPYLSGAMSMAGHRDPSWLVSATTNSPVNQVDADFQIAVRRDYSGSLEIYPLCFCDIRDVPTEFPGYFQENNDVLRARWYACQDLGITSSVWGIAGTEAIVPELTRTNRGTNDNPRWISQGVVHLTPTSAGVRPQIPGMYLMLYRSSSIEAYVLAVKGVAQIPPVTATTDSPTPVPPSQKQENGTVIELQQGADGLFR